MSYCGVLEVLLEHAEGIEDRNFFNCLNCLNVWDARKPYISIKYGNQELISNVAQYQGKGRKFIWNEKFRFQVECELEENFEAYDKLELHVMDKHHLSDNDYVGEATTHVKDVVIRGMEDGEFELLSSKYRVVRPDKSYSGSISFSAIFKRKDWIEEEEEEDLGGWKESKIEN